MCRFYISESQCQVYVASFTLCKYIEYELTIDCNTLYCYSLAGPSLQLRRSTQQI
jgi:hypothetical protein